MTSLSLRQSMHHRIFPPLLLGGYQVEAPRRVGGLDDIVFEPLAELPPQVRLQTRVDGAVPALDRLGLLSDDPMTDQVSVTVGPVVREQVPKL